MAYLHMGGAAGNVSVLLLDVTCNCVQPTAAAEILTVQLSWSPADVPVQLAVNVELPCSNFTVVEQDAADELHGKFVPLTWNA